MKRIFGAVCAVLVTISLTACGKSAAEPPLTESPLTETTTAVSVKETTAAPTETSAPQTSAETVGSDDDTPVENSGVLVAYFSATGNTKQLAEYMADALNCDIYEITPSVPYTEYDLNYNTPNSRASLEMNYAKSRPEISGSVEDMDKYDIIFLGYPIWWGVAPKIMYTFMESYDFSGKTIVPFCTSGSSPIGQSAENLRELASESTVWLDGDRLKTSTSRDEIAEWINGLGLDVKAK